MPAIIRRTVDHLTREPSERVTTVFFRRPIVEWQRHELQQTRRLGRVAAGLVLRQAPYNNSATTTEQRTTLPG